jgi:hypothetical protein
MHSVLARSTHVAILVASAVVACVALRWLWVEYMLFGLAASGLLVFGGFQLLPSRHLVLHSFFLGLSVGAAIGTFLGATAALS